MVLLSVGSNDGHQPKNVQHPVMQKKPDGQGPAPGTSHA
jgi:hypothetical protein